MQVRSQSQNMKFDSRCFPVMIVLGSALQASPASAQFLSERLTPPQQVQPPAVPMIAQPVEPRVFGADKPRNHLWALPFGTFPSASAVLATESRPADWRRPVIDTPILASDPDPARPAFPMQPTSPRAYAAAPNPLQVPLPARFPTPLEPIVSPSDDPSANSAFALLTAAVPLATPNSAPALRLSISDPFEHIRIIRLANAPADNDNSSTTQDRPPLAKLPKVESPK